jgi:phosphate:Na+ symporter
MVPQGEDTEEYRLQFINTGLLSTSELSIHQAKKEVLVYANRIEKMYGYVGEMFVETSDKRFYKLFDKVEKYEGISDRMEEEIADYLTKITEGELSILGSKRIKAMLNVVTDLESMGDSCYNLAKTLVRKKDKKITFDTALNENVIQIMELVQKAIKEMEKNLDHGYKNINITHALALEEKINRFRTRLKKDHLKSVEKKDYSYQTGIIYNDLYCECEKLADFAINVSEAIEEINH